MSILLMTALVVSPFVFTCAGLFFSPASDTLVNLLFLTFLTLFGMLLNIRVLSRVVAWKSDKLAVRRTGLVLARYVDPESRAERLLVKLDGGGTTLFSMCAFGHKGVSGLRAGDIIQMTSSGLVVLERQAESRANEWRTVVR